jgi:hypothetical protein
MAYQKLLVDNTTCSRRFHLTYDDQAAAVPRVEVRCQHCNAVIFATENQPPMSLARSENLPKTSVLADNLTSECHFKDTLSERTIPKATGDRSPAG